MIRRSSTHDLLARHYPEIRFGGFAEVDGTVAFYTRVNALLRPGDVVLDIGCGRGGYGEDPVELHRALRVLRGKCRRVIGIDVDEAARANPFVDEFQKLEGPVWPVADAAVDLAVCDFVVEHLDDPPAFFAEAARVIKPGGYLCVRTPNSKGYVALCSQLIPSRWHARVLGRVQTGRQAQDVFPTRYRCNSARRLRRALDQHGFDAVVYGHESAPSYLSFSAAAYYLGVLYQRLAPRMFANALFAFARKRGDG